MNFHPIANNTKMDMFLIQNDRNVDLKLNNLWSNVAANVVIEDHPSIRIQDNVWTVTTNQPEEHETKIVKAKKGRAAKPKEPKMKKEPKEGLFLREKRKRLRNLGLEYINSKGKVIPRKVPMAVDCAKCRYKCSMNFSYEDQERIHKSYWSTGCYRQQRAFICKYVHHGDILRRRKTKTGQPSRRNVSFIYYLPNKGKLVRVCKKFFLSSLSIGEKVVEITKSKEMTFYSAFATEDKRGRHAPANKITEEVIDHVKNSFRDFMAPGRSVSDMFQLYLENCRKNDIKHPVKFSKYRKLFNKEFSVAPASTKKVKKELNEDPLESNDENYYATVEPIKQTTHKTTSTNTAATNTPYQVKQQYQVDTTQQPQNIILHVPDGSMTVSTTLLTNKTIQQPPVQRYTNVTFKKEPSVQVISPIIKTEVVEMKKQQLDEITTNSNHFKCFIFNLKSMLYTPCVNVSSLPNSQKFCTYNLTIHDQNSRAGNCYVWNETEGRLEADEIGTILFEHLKAQSRNVNHVSFITDCIGDYNRNVRIATILSYAVKTLDHINLIDLKFLDSGQTEMEVDYLHNLIDKAKRDISVYSPLEWPVIIQLARKKKPIKMRFLYNKDFLDLSFLKAKTILGDLSYDSENKMVDWANMRWLQFRKNDENIYFKSNLDENFRTIFILRPRKDNGQLANVYDQVLKQKYSGQLAVCEAKKRELLNLCAQGIIPDLYHQFYKSIPTAVPSPPITSVYENVVPLHVAQNGTALQIVRPADGSQTSVATIQPIFTHVFTQNLPTCTTYDIRG